MIDLKLCAVAVSVALLLHVGICPLTIQLLVLGALLWGIQYSQSHAPPVAEHMVAARAPGFRMPEEASMTLRIDVGNDDVDRVKVLQNGASGASKEFTTNQENSSTEMIALAKNDPWKGDQESSRNSGLFGSFTFVTTVRMSPNAEAVLISAKAMMSTNQVVDIRVLVGPAAAGRRKVSLEFGADTVSAEFEAISNWCTIFVRKTGRDVDILQHSHDLDNGRTPAQTRRLVADGILYGRISSPLEFGRMTSDSNVSIRQLFVWQKALSEADLVEIKDATFKSQLMLEPTYQKLVKDLRAAEDKAAGCATTNPWGDSGIDRACPSVTNWKSPTALVDADPACWDVVGAFCKKPANRDKPGCVCWALEGDAADTDKCKKFRATVSSVPTSDKLIADLDVAALKELLKKKETPAGVSACPSAQPVPIVVPRRARYTVPTDATMVMNEDALKRPTGIFEGLFGN